MGCCPSKEDIDDTQSKKSTSMAIPFELKDQLNGSMNNTQIMLKMGDCKREQFQGFIVGSDFSFTNFSNLNLLTTDKQELQIQQALIKQFNSLNIQNPDMPAVQYQKNKNLPPIYIIYCVIPIWRDNEAEHVQKLKEIMQKIFNKCNELKIASLMITDFFSELFGYPKLVASKAITEVVKEFTSKAEQINALQKIQFVFSEGDIVELFFKQITTSPNFQAQNQNSVGDKQEISKITKTNNQQLQINTQSMEQLNEPLLKMGKPQEA